MSRRKWLLAMLPPTHRVWGEALLAEHDHVETDRTRWMLGSVQLLARAWTDWITGGNLMKTVLATLSIVNIVFGLFVLVLYAVTEVNPRLVLILGLSLIAQGGYTLWVMARSQTVRSWSMRLLLAGETFALLVGVGGVVGMVLRTAGFYLHPEYGPLAVAGLIAAQAATALYLYAIRGEAAPISR